MRVRYLIAALLLGLGLLVPLTSATAEPASAAPCGVYTTPVSFLPDDVWYNHCGTTNICIKVDYYEWYAFDEIKRVGPGSTWIGRTSTVRHAWYVGLPHPTLGCSIY